MGEHKRNPIAISAKNGELLPRPKKMSSAERQRLLYSSIQAEMVKRTGIAPGMFSNGGY